MPQLTGVNKSGSSVPPNTVNSTLLGSLLICLHEIKTTPPPEYQHYHVFCMEWPREQVKSQLELLKHLFPLPSHWDSYPLKSEFWKQSPRMPSWLYGFDSGVLTLQRALDWPGGLAKTYCWAPPPEFLTRRPGMGLNKFPNNTNSALIHPGYHSHTTLPKKIFNHTASLG